MSSPIRADVLAQLYAHARAGFPAECCGYITQSRVVRCTNVSATDPLVAGRTEETAFAIGGAELLAFARSFDGPDPAGIVYHSHTNGRAYFSATDREHACAYPVEHLVIGVTADGVREAARFDRELREVERWGAADLAAAVDAAIMNAPDWEDRWDAALYRALDHVKAGGLIADIATLQSRLAAVTISDAARAAHEDYLRPRKLVRGEPPRPDTRVPALVVAGGLDAMADEVAYETARRSSQAACDCAVLIELKRTHQRPRSPALRNLGGDGMYWNDWVCDACGQRWAENKACDDEGIWSSWEAVC